MADLPTYRGEHLDPQDHEATNIPQANEHHAGEALSTMYMRMDRITDTEYTNKGQDQALASRRSSDWSGSYKGN